MDTRETAEAFLRYWSVQDVPSCMAYLAENAVYTLHLTTDVVPFGGTTVGRDRIAEAFYAILADWDYLRYEPTILSIEDRRVRVKIDFCYRQRRSGNDLEGSYRAAAEVENGLITRIDEYHDAAFVESFVRMSKHVSLRGVRGSPIPGLGPCGPTAWE